MHPYKPRVIDPKLSDYLRTFGAVCLEGPKWCGKTRSSEEICKSHVYLGDPKNNFQTRHLAEISPDMILEGEKPRLLDEWQEVPPLWDAVRYYVDKSDCPGNFILTGSATPNHKGILHSGAGRIARLRMRPMSLWESGESTGTVSLKELAEGKLNPSITGEVLLKDLIHFTVRGGWPQSLFLPSETQGVLAKEYIKAVISDDATRIDGIQRNQRKLELVLRSLARHESATPSFQKLIKDVKDQDGEELDRKTLISYLDVYDRLFLTDNQKPFAPSVRSSKRLKVAEKRHFCDPSLAAALLKHNEESLLQDLETFGFLFESLCVRDLRIYAESFGAEIFHYQDYANQEIDAVISLKDGSWMGIEIKLGAHQIEDAAKNLLKIQASLENGKKNATPKVLVVLCGMSNAAYRRPDGVFVVPLTALKP